MFNRWFVYLFAFSFRIYIFFASALELLLEDIVGSVGAPKTVSQKRPQCLYFYVLLTHLPEVKFIFSRFHVVVNIPPHSPRQLQSLPF